MDSHIRISDEFWITPLSGYFVVMGFNMAVYCVTVIRYKKDENIVLNSPSWTLKPRLSQSELSAAKVSKYRAYYNHSM